MDIVMPTIDSAFPMHTPGFPGPRAGDCAGKASSYPC